MPANLARLLDGDNESLSSTLGLGDPIGASFSFAESRLILGKKIREPSLYSRALAPPQTKGPDYQLGPPDNSGGDGGGDGSDGSGGDE